MGLIRRAYDGVIFGLVWVGCAMLAAVSLLIVVDVVMRNLGQSPFAGTSALVEYAMLAATACGAPWLVRRGGHVAVDGLVKRLPPAAYGLMVRATTAFCAGVAGMLAWRAVVLALAAADRGQVDIRSVTLPGYLAYALLALGLGLCATEFLRLLFSGGPPKAQHGSAG